MNFLQIQVIAGISIYSFEVFFQVLKMIYFSCSENILIVNWRTKQNHFQDLKELFNRIDADSGNDLNLQEVHLFFKSITDDISDENIDRIFKNLDSNGDKSIDFNEFTVNIKLEIYLNIFPSSTELV